MKRLIIICEGPTELQFCQQVLYPHFLNRKICIECPLPKKSHGGCISWPYIKRDVETYLKGDKHSYVTLFIDFYGLHKKENFPNWDIASKEKNIYDRVIYLQNAMLGEIADEYRYRFIPNFIIHEFEGLLFNNINVIKDHFESGEIKNRLIFEKIFVDYPNPELINDGKETTPSKRLEKHIPGYKKITFANQIAKAIGLNAIRNKSKHFNEWIVKLETI